MPLPATACEIVLLGAGAAHLEVLRRFARQPPSGARLTLVTSEPDAPYAGRLPALIRGECTRSDACIDLAVLSAAAGARLILADSTGIDLAGQMLELAGRPPMPFDLLSVDLDGESVMPDVRDACIPVGPPGRFLALLRALEAALPDGARIAIIGGGPPGTELALALARRFAGRLRLVLVCETPEPLPAAPPLARRAVRAALVDAGVEQASAVLAGALIDGRLALSDGSFLPADAVLWAGGTRAPGFLAEAGLACDAAGRVLVDAAQRSVSHPCIFAAGDSAAPPRDDWTGNNWAGRVLTATLRPAARGRKLGPWRHLWRPPHVAPAMLDLGGGRAVAWSSGLAVAGETVGRAKDWFDRRCMRAYAPLCVPPHVAAGQAVARAGAATPAAVLAPLLAPLPWRANPDALVSLGTPDHVAVLTPPFGQALVQSIASLRTCLDDPFVFGQIAAAHALSEQYAMGARPWTALAIATVPAGARQAELGDMLAGAAEVLGADGCSLAGGHRARAAEASLGFAVSGLAEPAKLLRKTGLRTGDALLLTKPLGTGIILAGHARGVVRASWLCAATGSMRTSNAAASRVLRAHGVSACVAVNGCGLAGHLGEMLGASRAAAVLWWDAVPTLPGTLELLAPGGGSRRRGRRGLPVPAGADAHAALLADPETSGGLLAGVPPARADACLAALQAAGLNAAIVGVVVAAEPGAPMIRVEQG
jgi:selenide,water dikinase